MANIKPAILDFDIETSLMEVYTHYISSKTSLSYKQILKESKIISIAYSWDGTNKYEVLSWDDGDDSKMLEEFNKIAAKADFVCGHNAQGFDVKEIRAAIALRGLASAWIETPVIDTLTDYRRMFRFKSNRLDAIARSLGLGFKDLMSMDDWIKINEGVYAIKLLTKLKSFLGASLAGKITYIATKIAYPKCEAKDSKELIQQYRDSLGKMLKYNKQDVKLLRSVRLRLAKYVTPPMSRLNVGKQTFDFKCVSCKGVDFIKYGEYTYKKKGDKKAQRYKRYLCKGCSKINMPEKLS